jgi:hypothetical protein
MTNKKLAANRENALNSTGPKTPEGKKKASLNALKHGLRATCLAVPGLEQPQDWKAHRTRIVQDLAPAGYLEGILAERAASLLWRLGRVVRYESDIVAIAVKKAEENRQSDDVLSSITWKGITDLRRALKGAEKNENTLVQVFDLEPSANVSGEEAAFVLNAVAEGLDVDIDDEHVNLNIPGFPGNTYWEDFEGWTREMVEAGVQGIKAYAKDEHTELDPWQRAMAAALSSLKQARAEYENRIVQVDRGRREALLGPREIVDKVTRYETTLERSFFRTLHELQKLQAIRSSALVRAAS